MSTKITCIGPCGEAKEPTEFYGTSKKCKTCTLARQKALKEAKANGTGHAAPTKTGGVARKKKTKAVTKERQPDSRWEQPGGFGFVIELQVDEEIKKTDVHIEQTTSDLGVQNIWLSQYEARSLLSWLTEKLGTP